MFLEAVFWHVFLRVLYFCSDFGAMFGSFFGLYRFLMMFDIVCVFFKNFDVFCVAVSSSFLVCFLSCGAVSSSFRRFQGLSMTVFSCFVGPARVRTHRSF